MAKYPGAVNTGGYPSLELQQYMLQQRARTTIASAPSAEQQADSLRDIGAEIRNGTSAQALYALLTQNDELASGVKWHTLLADYVEEVLKSGTYTAAQRSRMMSIINGYALSTN